MDSRQFATFGRAAYERNLLARMDNILTYLPVNARKRF
jgi:hypothetical protein